MARHILKLWSLSKSNNNSNNNNGITLTCIFMPVHSEDPVWTNRQPLIYTRAVFQKFFYKLNLKFSKSLPNHGSVSRLVTKPGSFDKHLLNINLSQRIVEFRNYEFWARAEEHSAYRRQQERRQGEQKNSSLSHFPCNSERETSDFLFPPIPVFWAPSDFPGGSSHWFPCGPQSPLWPHLCVWSWLCLSKRLTLQK